MPCIILNPKQREAAILSDLEPTFCTISGTAASYRMEWPCLATSVIVKILKAHRPEHDQRAIPYQTLINNVLMADREQR